MKEKKKSTGCESVGVLCQTLQVSTENVIEEKSLRKREEILL